MKTTTRFTFDKVQHDQENEIHLVVTLNAPKKDWENKRPPICVFPVIDISGSMSGDKLDYAKKSAIKLVEHLQDGDYAGLAVFGSDVELISAPIEMTAENKTQLRQRIGDLHTRGMTNFSGGMLTGLGQLNNVDLPKGVVLRVIMLTDGHANQGVATDHNGLTKLLTANLDRVTMSCFGYGEGANQELLSDLAKTGKGNYAFIQNPDDAISAFAKELGGLLSTYAQNLEVTISSSNGHEIVEVLSDVDVDGDEKKAVVKLPEILSEEEIHLVLAVKLSKQTKALPRELNAFNVDLTYDFVTESGKVEKKSESLKAKIKFVKPGKEQKKPTKEVDEIVALSQTLKAQVEAEKMADAGQYGAAAAHMGMISDSFQTRGLVGNAAFAQKIGQQVNSNVNYCSSESYRTSTKSLGRRARGTSGANREATMDYMSLGLDTDTSAQEKLKSSFADDGTQVVIPPVITTPGFIAPTPPKDIAPPAPAPKPKVEKKKITKSRSKRW